MAALGLSACGRKGPLDPPPGAAVPRAATSEPQVPAGQIVAAPVLDSKGRIVQPGKKSPRGPVAAAPTGQQPNFILDWLLD
jgi:predicted small lipoprotein YifL